MEGFQENWEGWTGEEQVHGPETDTSTVSSQNDHLLGRAVTLGVDRGMRQEALFCYALGFILRQSAYRRILFT